MAGNNSKWIGWYHLEGRPGHGHRTVEEQLQGIETLATIRPKTVLDLGCAEGLISKWMVEHCGAERVDALTYEAREVQLAKQLCAGLPIGVSECDLNKFAWWRDMHPSRLLEGYDCVLVLSVLHKLRDPLFQLGQIAGLVKPGGWLFLRLPAPVIVHPKSGNVRLDAADKMLRLGFELLDQPRTCRDEWMGVYRRPGA